MTDEEHTHRLRDGRRPDCPGCVDEPLGPLVRTTFGVMPEKVYELIRLEGVL